MQISRHWRLNSQRYRLQGVRYQNGEVSIQDRPTPPSMNFDGGFARTVINRIAEKNSNTPEGVSVGREQEK